MEEEYGPGPVQGGGSELWTAAVGFAFVSLIRSGALDSELEVIAMTVHRRRCEVAGR